MSFIETMPKPFFVLAPMDDVTDSVFRRVINSCARPDLFFTEFVNVDGLQSPGHQNLLKKLHFTTEEQPLIAQIWGKNPENFLKTAEQIANGTIARELGLPEGVNFAGVDLNMGCPQKKEVTGGTCAALINNRPLAQDIISATKQGLADQMPVSVKTRIGFSQVDITWPEFLLNQNLHMLTIHGRTRKDKSKVPANWDAIGQIRELRDVVAPDTLIVGNGDVMNREQGIELAKKYNLDGIMIGRGVFHDPFAFADGSQWDKYSAAERMGLYKKHVELFAETWKEGERYIHTLNKFCKIYVNGFDGAKELREKLMVARSTKELISILNNVDLIADYAKPKQQYVTQHSE